ncbi:hypothetical protein F511_15124 [Dorcoceras hygrometricum]|uniref:Uncharacterized protein n=1 Tax=Dorcoceras hygrometricum TaxID=472368 RepID=A0A2Z7BMH0_9LAMI|nr:hypothetical protein F511_15124 [Dorcoceras hygrometricum]
MSQQSTAETSKMLKSVPKPRKSAYMKHNSKSEHSNTYGQNKSQVLNIYASINYKNRAQINEKFSPTAHASRRFADLTARRHSTSRSSSNANSGSLLGIKRKS